MLLVTAMLVLLVTAMLVLLVIAMLMLLVIAMLMLFVIAMLVLLVTAILVPEHIAAGSFMSWFTVLVTGPHHRPACPRRFALTPHPGAPHSYSAALQCRPCYCCTQLQCAAVVRGMHV